jgi:hypothetical protein
MAKKEINVFGLKNNSIKANHYPRAALRAGMKVASMAEKLVVL